VFLETRKQLVTNKLSIESTDLTQRAQDHGGFGQNRHGFGIGEGYKKRPRIKSIGD